MNMRWAHIPGVTYPKQKQPRGATPEELEILSRLLRSGSTPKAIAHRLNRNVEWVRYYSSKCGGGAA